MEHSILDVDLGSGSVLQYANRNGTGPFKTLETCRWMQALGVVLRCSHCHGGYLLE